MASKAIAAATSQLVSAAKAATKPTKEEVQLDKPTSDIAWKVKEMELQTHILKLEKDLDITRTKLLDMRRSAYS